MHPRILPSRRSSKSLVASAVSKFGNIDVLFNNASYANSGGVEDASIDQAQALSPVDFFCPLCTTVAILPSMRARMLVRRSGTIVNIGSSCGISLVTSLAIYSASKFALEGLTETLFAELSSFNIRMIIAEPSALATRFTNPNGSGVMDPLSEAYKGNVPDQAMQISPNMYDSGKVGSPENAARLIVETVGGTASSKAMVLD
ncbi:hypothetical protein BJ170DRAFT_715912 [Xylariales sp. AK1849]|nr:hypothetical protein BJ170DRAFT_715912 [Xylariales sp. AK1849]